MTTIFDTVKGQLVGGHLVIDSATDFGTQSAVSIAVRFKAEASARNATIEVGMARLNTSPLSRTPRRFVLAEDAKTAGGNLIPWHTLATWNVKPVVQPVKLLSARTKVMIEAGRYYWLIAQSNDRGDAADQWLWSENAEKVLLHGIHPGRNWEMFRGKVPAIRITAAK